jgi:hypothetical protein
VLTEEIIGMDGVEGSADKETTGESTEGNPHFHEEMKPKGHPEIETEGGPSLQTESFDDVDDGGDEEEDIDNDDENERVPIDEDQTEKYPKRRYRTPKIFQDAITVFIPLDVTADLKIAIKKTRAKRITSIYKRFPSLQKEAKNLDEINDPALDDDEDENAKDKDEKQPPKKKNKMENVPQPDQFGSVLDYLEAKYVKGVMLEEDDAPILDEEKSEGQGSVYSRDSFLDDTDLQRDVAEQVMASTTLTKLELEHEDGDFFVNVGTLEVENDDYGDNYDPLQDKENKVTKKRKKPSTTAAPTKASETKTPAQKKKSKTEPPSKKKEPTSAKSKKSTGSAASTKSKTTPQDKAMKATAKKAKTLSDSLFKKASTMIKKLTPENLPRLKTKLKVALKCPKNKKPGDDITFAYVLRFEVCHKIVMLLSFQDSFFE